MKCLILCGGRGMIDPSSKDRIPKALLKVGNRPLVWHVMKLFSSYGFTDFVLALGQGSEEINFQRPPQVVFVFIATHRILG